MKILKYLFFLLLIAFISGSIYIATKDGDYHLQESVVIEAPVPLLFEEVNDYNHWENWSPWHEQEDVIIEYSDTTSGEGAAFSWKSDVLIDGSIQTKAVIPNSSLEQSLLLQLGLGKINSNLYWNFEPTENGTKVTWQLKGSQSFKEKLAISLHNKDLIEIMEPKLEQGLQELEKAVTAKMEEYSIHVDGTTVHGGGYYMYSTTATKINEVNERASKMIKQIILYMKNNNISIGGNPFVLFNQRNEQNQTTIFSTAVPTANEVITPSGSPVLNGYLPRQKVVKTTLKGNYKNIGEAWEKTYRYIEDNDLTLNTEGQPFEVYVTGPAEEENPALWITEIYVPIE